MEKLKDKPIDEQVKYITSHQSVSDSEVEMLHKYFDVEKHDVMDKNIRADRAMKERVYDETTGETIVKDVEDSPVNRVPLPIANDIIRNAVTFACGNPLDVSYGNMSEEQIKAIEDVIHDNKDMSLNRRMCRALFAFREVAEIWYLEDDRKIRCHLVSPMFGDKLFPIIDRKRKMQGFAYQVSYKEGEDEVKELTFYTKEKTTLYKTDKEGKWSIVSDIPNIWRKIPAVYTNQKKADYEEVIHSILRTEKAVSNLGDSVDDSAYPDKVYKGKFLGQFHTPGQGSKYQLEGDGDVKIVESQQATNLIELDIDTNRTFINSLTQNPDLSLENLKGLGSGLSGEVLKRMLTGAILKVQDKREYLDEHYQRRYNIIKTILAVRHGWKSESMTITTKVIPYVPEDKDAEIDRLRKLQGIMPKRYIIKVFKDKIDPSIDEEEIMKWIKDESEFEYGDSLIS